MFLGNVVLLGDLVRNFGRCLPALQPTPNQHRRLVKRVVALCVQVDEYGLSTVELGVYDVTMWLRCRGSGHAILLTLRMFQLLLVAGASITGREREPVT
jgi:hypothetical protein